MPRTTVDRIGYNLKSFSGWVFANMKGKGMTQKDLAVYLNTTPGNISHKLSGRVAWSLKDAFRIFELFGESYEWR